MKIFKSNLSEKERDELNSKILLDRAESIHGKENHCTNPNCEYYKDYPLKENDYFCPLCGEMSTLYESKVYGIN